MPVKLTEITESAGSNETVTTTVDTDKPTKELAILSDDTTGGRLSNIRYTVEAKTESGDWVPVCNHTPASGDDNVYQIRAIPYQMRVTVENTGLTSKDMRLTVVKLR